MGHRGILASMHAEVISRIEARRRRLERVLIVASGSVLFACGPELIDSDGGDGQTSVADGSTGTGVSTQAEGGTDDGISTGVSTQAEGGTDGLSTGTTETETETGEGLDDEMCLSEIDVAGVGDCDDPVGYRWTTGGCTAIWGCTCEGADCEQLYDSQEACDDAYDHCDLCDPCPDTEVCVVYCDGTGFVTGIYCRSQGAVCEEPYVDYTCEGGGVFQPLSADLECAGPGRVVFTRAPTAPTVDSSRVRQAARAWARVTACETASVTSFEALAIQLRALAAPVELVAAARRFADDERRHARAVWAVARSRDPEVEPAPLPQVITPDSLEALLEDTILAGCIGETLSALELEHMAESCRVQDPKLTATLREIADDEARHAEHAWTLIAWMLQRWPELRARAQGCFGRRCETIDLGVERSMPEHGLLADSVRAELWALGRRRVVEPLASLCLGQPARTGGRDASRGLDGVEDGALARACPNPSSFRRDAVAYQEPRERSVGPARPL
jgi:rubrerythrin